MQYKAHALFDMALRQRGHGFVFRRASLLYMQWAVIAISMLFPVAALIVPKGLGGSFYLLLLCSSVAIALRIRPLGKSLVQIVYEYWPVNLAMSGLLLATLANQLSSGELGSNILEWPLQLACFPFLCWVLLLLSDAQLKRLSLGLGLGAIACAVVLYIESDGGAIRPLFVFAIPVIPFANIALLLGILALLSIGWNSSKEKPAIAFKIVAGAAGLYASFLSQARGGWIAIPVFVVIALLVVFRNLHFRHKLLSLLVVAIGLSATYMVSHTVQERFSVALTDIEQFVDGTNKDTSFGQRIQLWQGGWKLFVENPVLGIGRKHYPEAVEELMMQQVLTPLAASQPHTHNDMLFQMVSLGVFGLIAILSLYFVPAWYFFKEIHNPDRAIRTIAGMGLVHTLGFFIYGLSDTMFFWRVSYVFYVMLLAILFAKLIQRKLALKAIC